MHKIYYFEVDAHQLQGSLGGKMMEIQISFKIFRSTRLLSFKFALEATLSSL